MRLAAVLLLCATPVLAEQIPPPPIPLPDWQMPMQPGEEGKKGFSLLEEGTRLIFKEFLDQMAPHLDEMQKGLQGAAEEWGPALEKLISLMDDIRHYKAPEMLPNGDILIRKKTPEEIAAEEKAAPESPDALPPAPVGPEIEL